jgi:hypothetical protein
MKTFSGLFARGFNLTAGSFLERKRSKVFSGKNRTIFVEKTSKFLRHNEKRER